MNTPVSNPSTAAPSKTLLPPNAARFAVSVTFFVNGALFSSWFSRIPALKADRGLSHGTLGLALLAVALGAVVAMPFASLLISRIGSKRVTQIAATLFCIALPCVVLAPSGLPFALALFWLGAVHGSLDVAMITQGVAVEERYRRPINSSFHGVFSIGGLTGATAGGLAATAGISPLAHFTMAACILGALISILAFPRLLDAGEAGARKLLEATQPKGKFQLPKPALLALGAVAFSAMMGEGSMADWSAVFMRQAAGATEGLAAAGFAAFSLMMAAGRFSGDALCARFGPVALVRASGALAAFGMALALFHVSPVTGLIGFACIGAGLATVVPLAFSAAGRTKGVASSAALATASTIGYFGFLLGPPIIGFVAELVGLRGALSLIIGTSLLVVALAPMVGTGAPALPRRKAAAGNAEAGLDFALQEPA